MRLIVLAFCLLAATACDEKSPTGPSVNVDQQFTLSRGELATVTGTTLKIQFLEVSGDSRCPADAVCVLGGDATVHVRVYDDGAQSNYELHTGDSSRGSVSHKSRRITLEQLQPYPFSSRTIAQDEYRATLTVR